MIYKVDDCLVKPNYVQTNWKLFIWFAGQFQKCSNLTTVISCVYKTPIDWKVTACRIVRISFVDYCQCKNRKGWGYSRFDAVKDVVEQNFPTFWSFIQEYSMYKKVILTLNYSLKVSGFENFKFYRCIIEFFKIIYLDKPEILRVIIQIMSRLKKMESIFYWSRDFSFFDLSS